MPVMTTHYYILLTPFNCRAANEYTQLNANFEKVKLCPLLSKLSPLWPLDNLGHKSTTYNIYIQRAERPNPRPTNRVYFMQNHHITTKKKFEYPSPPPNRIAKKTIARDGEEVSSFDDYSTGFNCIRRRVSFIRFNYLCAPFLQENDSF